MCVTLHTASVYFYLFRSLSVSIPFRPLPKGIIMGFERWTIRFDLPRPESKTEKSKIQLSIHGLSYNLALFLG